MKLAGEIAYEIQSKTKKNEVKLVCLGIGTFEKAVISTKIKRKVVWKKLKNFTCKKI